MYLIDGLRGKKTLCDTSVTDGHTGGSRRAGISPSLSDPALQLLSSHPPASDSACAQCRLPPLPQTGGGGLYPGRGRMADFPLLTQAGTKHSEKLRIRNVYLTASMVLDREKKRVFDILTVKNKQTISLGEITSQTPQTTRPDHLVTSSFIEIAHDFCTLSLL